jgi:hypothetical protein
VPQAALESTWEEALLPALGVATTVGTTGIGHETARRVTGETSATDAGSAGT